MTNKEKLIRLMQEKRKKLEKIGIDGNLYFNEDDTNIIKSWKEKECKRIV